ncbi:MAG: DUF2971 domain-containing protein [Pseudomonadota bacterium]
MTEERWALKILRERRLKISLINDANDPFELLGASVGEKKTRSIMKTLHSHWVSTLGMLCMTTDWKSPVMWAHYADKHHGLCLGFDVSEDAAPREVQYSPQKLNLVIDLQHKTAGITADLINTIVLTKFKEWSYEKEFRIFTQRVERDTDDKYYYDLSPSVVLREVIIGHRCEIKPSELRSHVGSVEKSVSIFKARPAFNAFEMVRQQKLTPVVVKPTNRPIKPPLLDAKH